MGQHMWELVSDDDTKRVSIGSLAKGQMVKLPCGCTGTYGGSDPLAKVKLWGNDSPCDLHGTHTEAVSKTIEVGTLTEVFPID
jgi:hypothetical protein